MMSNLLEDKSKSSISYFRQQIDFWISSEFYAVGVSAFVGVAIRVALENFFAGKSTTDKGNFIDIFFQNTYLVPNLIGSFIMAVCIANMKQITDVSTPLYKFLTTGLCGCITTYSSWMNGVLDSSFDKYSFYGMPIRILLEFWLTWSIFTVGFSSVKLVGEFQGMMLPPSKAPPIVAATPPTVVVSPTPTTSGPTPATNTSSLQPKSSKRSSTVKFADSEDGDDGRMLSNEEAQALEAEAESSRQNTMANRGNIRSSNLGLGRSSNFGIGRVSSARGMRSSNLGTDGAVTIRPSVWGRGSAAPQKYDRNNLFAVEEEVVFNEIAGRISVWREDGMLESEASDSWGRRSLAVRARTAKPFGRSSVSSSKVNSPQGSLSDARTVSNGVELKSRSNTRPFSFPPSPSSPSNLESGQSSAVEEDEDEGFLMNCLLFLLKYEYYFWATLFWIPALIMWSLLIVGRDLSYFENATGRNLFRSVALAPFGAWVRWVPTRLPWIKAYWPEMNPQTFIVNQLAVFVMACLVIFAPNYSWTIAIDNGRYLL